MDLKSLLKHKTVLVLLLVVVVNLVVFAFMWRLDDFVHHDLYGYGLVFNLAWASEYWGFDWMVLIFLGGATVLAAVSMVPHYRRNGKSDRLVKYAAFLLPVSSLVSQALAIVNLDRIDNLVWSGLYPYGLSPDIDWSSTYNPISLPALGLMVVGLFALIVSAVAALNIIQIEIVHEEEDLGVGAVEEEAELEKAAVLEEVVKPLGTEEEADLTAPTGQPLKLAESIGKPAKEEEKPEAAKEGAQEPKVAKKRRRRKRHRKRRRSALMAT